METLLAAVLGAALAEAVVPAAAHHRPSVAQPRLLPVPQMLCKQLTTTPMQMTASYLPLLAIALPTTGSSKLPGTHATCEQV